MVSVISVVRQCLRQGNRYLKVHERYGLANLKRSSSPTESLYVTLPLGRESAIQATLDAPNTLDAPLEAGAIVGNVKIMLGERILTESPVAVAEAVPEGGFFKRMIDFVLRLFA